MSRVRRVAIGTLLVLALGAGGTNPQASGVGTPGQTAAATRVHLAAIPAWTQLATPLAVDLRVEPPAPDLEVVLTVRARLGSRLAWERTLDGGSLGAPVGSVTVPLAGLTPGPVGTHRVTVGLGPEPPAPSGGEPDDDEAVAPLPRIPVTQEGVYPLQVELRPTGGGEAIDQIVTYVVALDAAQPPTPLAVAWIWPLSVPIPRTPGGAISPSLSEALAPAGRLSQLVGALTAVPETPVTLAVGPATLDSWAELAAGAPSTPPAEGAIDPAFTANQHLATLRAQAAAAGRQIAGVTYAPADLAALSRAGLRDEIPDQLAEGDDVVGAVLGIRTDPRTLVTRGGLDPATLGVLRDSGVDRLVVDRDVLAPIFEQLTPGRPFRLAGRQGTFAAVSPEPTLAAVLRPHTGETAEGAADAEVAQQLLAGLAIVSLESPGQARGVVVMPPADWRPTTALLTAALRGLNGHPSLRPVTLDGYFADVAPDEDDAGRRSLEPGRGGRLAVEPAALVEAKRRVTSLALMTPDGAPEPVRAGRQLLLAQATQFQRREANPSAGDYVAGAEATVNAVLGAVRLPARPGVTLTARQGRVPITLVNDGAVPLDVRVRLSSDRLLFPDGDEHGLTLPPRSTTAQFTVEARTSGAHPMTVEITSPDGVLLVGSFEMTVRSTAVSGVALALTVGAGLFLAGWWGNHIRRARRRRREEEAEDAALGEPEPRPGDGRPSGGD